MSTKPNRNNVQELDADAWVQGTALTTNGIKSEKEATARFTIDIPVSLHARIKSESALNRVKMREVVLGMLEEKFPVN